MEEIKNLRKKRVCDMRDDHKVIDIGAKGYITRISANPDGTLKIEQFEPPKAA
jgi:hypothetical protein